MYIGMDLHKNYLQVAVLDEKGRVLKNSRVNNEISTVGRFFDRINSENNAKVVMESSCVWYNIYDYLSNTRHLEVILSNPIKTKGYCICKDKNRQVGCSQVS